MNELVKQIIARDSSPETSQRDRFALMRQLKLIHPDKRKEVIAFIKSNLQQLQAGSSTADPPKLDGSPSKKSEGDLTN
jgi:hypothetical protein